MSLGLLAETPMASQARPPAKHDKHVRRGRLDRAAVPAKSLN
jgi:hypothetical protein